MKRKRFHDERFGLDIIFSFLGMFSWFYLG